MRNHLKTALRQVPALSVLFAFGSLARGSFRGLAALGWGEAAALVFLLASLAGVVQRRVRRHLAKAEPHLRDDLELGALLISTAYVWVAIGGQTLFPIVYLLMAFLVSFLPRTAGLILLGVALVFDGLKVEDLSARSLSEFAVHAAFLVLFAALYHLVLSARLATARRAENNAVQNRIKEVEERARTFRLVASGSQDSFPGLKDQEKWLMASVKEIEGAVGAALEIAEAALETRTCAAFLLTSDDRQLKLYDCRSASDRVQRERFPAGEGVLGGVLKRSVPVRMASPKGLKGITYYDGAVAVGSLAAVPIVEASGLVRGVLVADRIGEAPFTERDERILGSIAGEVLRAIEVERVMNYIRKSRDEKDRFFRAIEELNRANSPEQVFVAVIEATRQLAGIDFCAVTLVNEVEGKRVHRVARMTGVTNAGRALEGYEFPDNNGLVSNVVRYGAPLPGREL